MGGHRGAIRYNLNAHAFFAEIYFISKHTFHLSQYICVQMRLTRGNARLVVARGKNMSCPRDRSDLNKMIEKNSDAKGKGP